MGGDRGNAEKYPKIGTKTAETGCRKIYQIGNQTCQKSRQFMNSNFIYDNIEISYKGHITLHGHLYEAIEVLLCKNTKTSQ